MNMKSMPIHRLGLTLALFGAASCSIISGLSEFELADGCSSIDDCKAEQSSCRIAVRCDRAQCLFEYAPAGTLVPEQITGDCAELVCDGSGGVDVVPVEGDGCVCIPAQSDPCPYNGPAGTEGVGACHAAQRVCAPDGLGYGPCEGEQLPQDEACDSGGVDEDCDGLVNEEGADCVCGDGYVSAGEPCDDGNMQEGDRCTQACELQAVHSVVAGGAHSCAILTNDTVKCWGRNDYGQLGLGDTASRGDSPGEMGENLPVVSLGTARRALSLAAGGSHTCAVLDDGTVKCWGRNDYGQLGQGDTAARGDSAGEMGDALLPVNLGVGRSATAVSAGFAHTCALLDDGTIKCWGRNDQGQLGLGDTSSRGDGAGEMGNNLASVALGAGKMAVEITVGYAHSCARFGDGSVKCWGDNDLGRLGLGDTEDRGDQQGEMGDSLPPVDLGLGVVSTSLAAAYDHTCAVLVNGSLKCWGLNGFGRLGLGDTLNRGDGPGEMGDALPPVNLGQGRSVLTVAGGVAHTCAILDDDSLRCWGYNVSGQLGLGDTSDRGDASGEMGASLSPTELGADRTVVGIAAGGTHVCAVIDDGSMKCWGDNASGRLGLGDISARGDGPGEMGDGLPIVKFFSDIW